MQILFQYNHYFSKTTSKSHSIKSTDSGFNFMLPVSAAATTAQGRNPSMRNVKTPSDMKLSMLGFFKYFTACLFYSQRDQKVNNKS